MKLPATKAKSFLFGIRFYVSLFDSAKVSGEKRASC